MSWVRAHRRIHGAQSGSAQVRHSCPSAPSTICARTCHELSGSASLDRPACESWRECEGVEPSADGEGSLPADLKSVKPTGTHPLPRFGHTRGGYRNISVFAARNGPVTGAGGGFKASRIIASGWSTSQRITPADAVNRQPAALGARLLPSRSFLSGPSWALRPRPAPPGSRP